MLQYAETTMSTVLRQVLHCDVCSWEWIPRADSKPTWCPNPKCRSRKWNSAGSGRDTVQTRHTSVHSANGNGVQNPHNGNAESQESCLSGSARPGVLQAAAPDGEDSAAETTNSEILKSWRELFSP